MNRDLATLITLGKRAYAEMDFRRAEALLREAISAGANYPDIHFTLGLISHHEGNFDAAVREFRRSLALNPEYAEALMSLAITLNEMGRYEEAREAHRKAASSLTRIGKTSPDNKLAGKIANLHAELGVLYLATGRIEEAIEEYRKALRVAPGFPDLRVRLATALREAGRLEEGLGELEITLSSRPDLVPALAQRGIILYLLGRNAEARDAWEKALFRDPLNKLVQLYLNTLERETGAG
jgi:tetratricopeptide (TPR) repeat protein